MSSFPLRLTYSYFFWRNLILTALLPFLVSRASALDPNRVLTLEAGHKYLLAAVTDQTRGFSYFTTDNSPGRVLQVRLSDSAIVNALELAPGENELHSAVIDEAGGFLYIGTATSPAKVVKVDIRGPSPIRVSSITMPSGVNHFHSAAIDNARRIAYFGCDMSPTKVVSVDLSTFTLRSTINLNLFGMAHAMDIDIGRQMLYVASDHGEVTRVDLSTSQQAGMVSLNTSEHLHFHPAASDQNFLYLGAAATPGVVVRIRKDTFTHDGTIVLPAGQGEIHSIVIDTASGFLYAASSPDIHKIALSNFSYVGKTVISTNSDPTGPPWSGTIDRARNIAYFGTKEYPTKLVKVDLSNFSAIFPYHKMLWAGDGYITSSQVDPVNHHLYLASYGTPEGRLIKVDAASMQRLGALELPKYSYASAIDLRNGFVYVDSAFTLLHKVRISDFSQVATIDVPGSAGYPRTLLTDTVRGFLYNMSSGFNEVILNKVSLLNASQIETHTVPSFRIQITAGILDENSGNAYFSTHQGTGVGSAIVKITPNTFHSPVTIPINEFAYLTALFIDPQGTYGYFFGLALDHSRNFLLKYNLSNMQLVSSLQINNWSLYGEIEPSGRYGFLIGPKLQKVDLENMLIVDSFDNPSTPEDFRGFTSISIDPGLNRLFLSRSSYAFTPAEILEVVVGAVSSSSSSAQSSSSSSSSSSVHSHSSSSSVPPTTIPTITPTRTPTRTFTRTPTLSPTNTPAPVCTAPVCTPPGVLTCSSGSCPGGCGVTCVVPPTPTRTSTPVVSSSSSSSLSSSVSSSSSSVSSGDTPNVSIASPSDGAYVQRGQFITIRATATDANGIRDVRFYVNDTLKCTDLTFAYTCNWRVPNAKNRNYRIRVEGRDPADNVGVANISVTTTQPQTLRQRRTRR